MPTEGRESPGRRTDASASGRRPTTTFDDLLSAYATGFFGYGSRAAPFWFIGLEEGGGSSFAEVERQIGCWDARGRPEVDDLAEVQTCMGLTRWSGPQPPLQTTWAQLIRVVLAAQGKPTDVESVRQYQATRLGRKDAETRLIELLPLPSQSTSQWRYAEWTTLPQFSTREAYVDHVARLRTERIKREVARHRPAAVLMYGLARFAREAWQDIASVEMSTVEGFGRRVQLGTNGNTTYIVCPHPAAHGVAGSYFSGIGRLLNPAG